MPRAGAAGLIDRAWDALRMRCPVCRKGRIFAGIVKMHSQCPACRYVFEREPGYFLGAIAIGYFLGLGALAGLAFALHSMVPTLDWEWCFIAAVVPYLFVTPVVFRYSRTIWMYFDNWLDPPGA